MKTGTEFWETDKTLNILAEEEYFTGDDKEFSWPEGLQPLLETPEGRVTQAKPDKQMALRALGAIVWYLRQGWFSSYIILKIDKPESNTHLMLSFLQ